MTSTSVCFFERASRALPTVARMTEARSAARARRLDVVLLRDGELAGGHAGATRFLVSAPSDARCDLLIPERVR